MIVSMEQVMRSIHNYFEDGFLDGKWSIAGNTVTPDSAFAPGEHILICGSRFHDGVWQLSDQKTLMGQREGAPDESFRGRVFFLHPPRCFMEICEAIAAFAEKSALDDLKSESFGEYSMTRANGKNGGMLTWQEAFAEELRPYRRMYTGVK